MNHGYKVSTSDLILVPRVFCDCTHNVFVLWADIYRGNLVLWVKSMAIFSSFTDAIEQTIITGISINQSVVADYGAKPEHTLEHKYHEKVRL